MKQSPLLKFESSAFAVVPGEDKETNPGIYGKTLAGWLGEQLRLAGVAAEDVIAEDFGWCVPVKTPPYSLYVACANDEAADHWQIFTFVEGGLMDRILRKDKSAELLAFLYATVRRCLESSSAVHGLREDTLNIS
jgi:hypothetical protein